jgi:hypothetical protein
MMVRSVAVDLGPIGRPVGDLERSGSSGCPAADRHRLEVVASLSVDLGAPFGDDQPVYAEGLSALEGEHQRRQCRARRALPWSAVMVPTTNGAARAPTGTATPQKTNAHTTGSASHGHRRHNCLTGSRSVVPFAPVTLVDLRRHTPCLPCRTTPVVHMFDRVRWYGACSPTLVERLLGAPGTP